MDHAQMPPTSLMATVQVLAEMDTVYTPLMKRGRSESIRASDVSRRYGAPMVSLLQRYCGGELEFWARCKRAALLWDWLEGTPIETLEKSYTVNPFNVVSYGDVIRIAETTRFHLRSAHQILSTLLTEHPDFLTSLDTILKRLEFGLPESAMVLTELRTPLTRGQYIALWQAGCGTCEEVAQLSDEQLIACVGPTAAQLLKVADSCNGLQSKRARLAISAVFDPHYMLLSLLSGPHYVPLSLQSSAPACNHLRPTHINCH